VRQTRAGARVQKPVYTIICPDLFRRFSLFYIYTVVKLSHTTASPTEVIRQATRLNVRILIPSGVLGLGFDKAALAVGVANQPDAICIDGGSTDSGPFYLGTGTTKYSEAATRSEWRDLLIARHTLGVPLIIGSCGTCGTDSTVDWMYDLTLSIASELGYNLKVARLYCSQNSTVISQALNNHKIQALSPELPIANADIDQCSNIVALAGVEQINAAVDTGADVILAGRTTDTAVIAAIPIARGVQEGTAWHGSKIGECGALCSTDPTSGVIQIDFRETEFVVTPLAEGATCTPHSVSAHMLYENADPLRLLEPGGVLDVSSAHYSSLDERSVSVTGSQWIKSDRYTVKLEAARLAGYQTSSLVIVRQPGYVSSVREWVDKLTVFLTDHIQLRMNLTQDDYTLECRMIGIDATLGTLEYLPSSPSEVGILVLITAGTQAIATDIAKLCNPFLLHFPLTSDEALPTFAFPYSPAESERGAIFEFALNHILILDDPMECFRIKVSGSEHATLS